nr:zinc knuckle CX2CX4HX4C [Tanacetum cinerariifolium]
MADMPKIVREGFYTCNIYVEYEWKPPRCVCCKVFGHFQEECLKNIGAGEMKNLKKPSQTPRGVLVVTLVDGEGKPLEKVESSRDYDSEDEVASVNNEMASFLARKNGYGTNSLLEQWKESYENNDYEYDQYDDDMYEGHEIPDKIKSICDNLDLKVRGRKKK